jgi:predicted esterase YcpF (UPF0227 family)
VTPTILYLHGFRSSPQSAKARLFDAAVAALPEAARPRLHAPALVPEPARAVAGLANWIDAERRARPDAPLTIVGSSLGGFYATTLAERYGIRAVLINPAIRPYADLADYVGVQENLYTGERFVVTREHFDELRALRVDRITRPDRYFLLVRTGDELLDWREAVAHYAGGFQYVAGGGDHSWTEFGAEIGSVLRFAGVMA